MKDNITNDKQQLQGQQWGMMTTVTKDNSDQGQQQQKITATMTKK